MKLKFPQLLYHVVNTRTRYKQRTVTSQCNLEIKFTF